MKADALQKLAPWAGLGAGDEGWYQPGVAGGVAGRISMLPARLNPPAPGYLPELLYCNSRMFSDVRCKKYCFMITIQ